MPGPNPYQYQFGANDDPVSVASVYGVTPQQLLAANPGGAPFTTGQMINIPTPAANYQYSTPGSPAPTSLGVSANARPWWGLGAGRTTGTPAPGISIDDMRGRGYGQQSPTAANPAPGTSYMWGQGGGQTSTLPAGLNYQRFDPTTPAAAPGTTPNTSSGDFYGYERDPETGRSVRVVKNAATGGDFLKELRWDPQRRRYVSIGSLLRSGRLDIKGNWRGRRGGGGGGQARKQQQEQNKQDFSLSNSLISFGASSG
jgi:hypothetical protein